MQKLLLNATIVENLRGHIIRIDPYRHQPADRDATALRLVPFCLYHWQTSALYQYPTGEEWLFVIPATVDELHTDITYFIERREPRFEIGL